MFACADNSTLCCMLISGETMEDKDSIKPPSTCRKVSLSLPKDHLNFSVNNDELKEAMKTYPVKNMAINN